MTSLTQQIMADIKNAMKQRDQDTLTVLRSLKSALQNATINKFGASEGELDDAEAMAVIRKAIKQRQDSATSFRQGDREELAQKEEAEIAVLQNYLPAALDESELESLVEQAIEEVGATTKKQMGQVMKLLQEKTQGRADNKTLSQLVAKRLG